MLTDDIRVLRFLEYEEAMERLRKNFYHLWRPLMEARDDPSLSERWRNAPRHSQEWRKAIFYEQALRVVEISARE
jgi:hypothetical protein